MPPENSETHPSYELPPVKETGSESSSNSAESLPVSPETDNSPKGPKVSKSKTQIMDFSLKSFGGATPPAVASTTTSTDNPTVADDTDLIEKEWVIKAKKIIEENREDPKNQSKEINNFKADYMKKRYNKVIKVSE